MKKFCWILSRFWKIVRTHFQSLSLSKRGENRNSNLSSSPKFLFFVKEWIGEFGKPKIFCFLTIIVFISFLVSCTFSEESFSGKKDSKLPDEEADSVKIISMTKDIIDYELEATHIDRFYKKKLTLADSIFITTFNPDGSIKSTLSSDKAEMDEAKNILTAIDNVIVKSENGIMKTPFLIWNKNTDEFYAKNGVTLIREDNVLQGQEMKTDGNLERIEIIKVSAEGKIDESEIDW